MSISLGVDKNTKNALRGLSIVLVAVGLWLALCVRVSGVDQPYLMIIAQEVIFGHHKETLDFPSSVYLHAPPILALHWLGWPVIFSWNLYIAVACTFSAYVFAFRMNTNMRGVVMCLWLAATLLLFDDTIIGQREYFFAIIWFPYLMARLHKPTGKFAIVDIFCGLLLSVTICVKFYFLLFTLVIDIPLFLLARRVKQSYAAFYAMTVGGLAQGAIYFRTYSMDPNAIAERFHSVYGTIGLDHWAVVRYLFASPAVYISAAVIAVIAVLNVMTRRRAIFAIACAASAVVCLVLAVMQGGPRPYNFVPLFLAAIACGLEAVFSQTAAKSAGDDLLGDIVSGRAVMAICAIAAVAVILFSDTGLGRAVLMKYFWHQSDYARIGPVPEDPYMVWVRKHVAADEDVDVIALQYGGTSAFDPMLSTIRLGRRVNSSNPILQFPLRVALVLGGRERIAAAWDALIEEIADGAPAWVVVRRTTPEPMVTDFVKIIEAEPRFYSWFTAHYKLFEEFGPYVAYRRSG
jgi:hypothetical protein